MAYRIAFDLDGVLADLDKALAAVAARLGGARVVSEGSEQAPGDVEADEADRRLPYEELSAGGEPDNRLSREREIWRAVAATENFWETLDEIEEGAVARLAELAAANRWEVIFLTQRPPTAGDPTQVQSQRWLAAHGFALPSVCVATASRGRVAEVLNLDVVVDDRAENCLDVVTDSKAKAILIWRGHEAHVVPNARRLGIEVAASVGECLKMLAGGHLFSKSRGTLVGRVRCWLDPSATRPLG